MKTAFFTFEQYMGKKEIGSTRIRCDWLINHWQDVGPDIGKAERFKAGQKYDVVIFQKAFWMEYVESFEGIKILDLCDPEWMHWGSRIKQFIDSCDAVTTSTMTLAKYIGEITDVQVRYIADRVDLDIVTPRKKHEGDAKAVAWYGYSQNYQMLESAIPAIKKLGLSLIVISDKGGYVPKTIDDKLDLTNYPFNQNTLYDDLARADIIINPKSDAAHWKYKSENKTVQAWAIGMPVAENDIQLKALIPVNARIEAQKKNYEAVKKDYDVKLSVIELKNLILQIRS